MMDTSQDEMLQQLSLMNDTEREAALGPLLKLWGTPGRNAMLEDQLVTARALRQPSGRQYTAPVGAALGGLGDIFRGVHGSMMENKAMGQMNANQAALEDPKFFNNPIARQLLLAQMLRKKPDPAAIGAGDMVPAGSSSWR